MPDRPGPPPLGALLIDLLDSILYLDKKQVVAVGDVRLHPSESHMLMCAVEGMSFTAIAEHFAVTKGAVSQVFSRLAAKGVVVVSKDPARRNAAAVSLTPLGEALHDRTTQLRAQLAQTLDDRLAGYTPTERAVVARFLRDLRGFVTATLADPAAQPGALESHPGR